MKRIALQQKFTEIIQRGSPLNIIFLFDSSSSIGSADFNRAKRAAISLIWKFGCHVSIGTAQFGGDFQEECEITDQRRQTAIAVQGMNQLHGTTAMDKALAGVIGMFHAAGRPEAEKYLIIFTDGEPDDGPAALRQAQLVQAEGVTIVCIGIGKVAEEYLQSISSPDCSFLIDSYRDLMKQLPTTATLQTRGGIPNSEINVTLNLVGKPIAFIGALIPPKVIFAVEITNNGHIPVERGSRITLLDEQKKPFFRKKIVAIPDEIPILESLEIEVVVDVCAGAKISNIPKFLKVIVTNTKNAEYWTEAPESWLPMDYFVGDLFNWKLNPDLTLAQAANILFFGWNGSGKSTFINKGLSLVSNAVRRATNVMFGNQSTTTSVEEFRMDGAPVNLKDTPGLSMDLYAKGEFSLLLSGLLPPDWTIDRAAEEPLVGDVKQITNKRVHSLVFMYPINSLDDANSMSKMRQFIDSSIRNYHYQPILLLSFGDYVPVEDHPARKLKAHRELGIIEADIYILDNRDTHDDIDTYVYRTVYEVIYKAMKYAEERMKKYPDTM